MRRRPALILASQVTEPHAIAAAVIPAKAGIQRTAAPPDWLRLDSRLRGNDDFESREAPGLWRK